MIGYTKMGDLVRARIELLRQENPAPGTPELLRVVQEDSERLSNTIEAYAQGLVDWSEVEDSGIALSASLHRFVIDSEQDDDAPAGIINLHFDEDGTPHIWPQRTRVCWKCGRSGLDGVFDKSGDPARWIARDRCSACL